MCGHLSCCAKAKSTNRRNLVPTKTTCARANPALTRSQDHKMEYDDLSVEEDK